jgi:membrane fusion protein (multidrug efflux system)
MNNPGQSAEHDTPPGNPPLRLSRWQRKRLILLVVIPMVAVVGGGTMYLKGGRYVETDNAYVKADKIPVSAEVSGTVAEVLVQENQAVKAGQLLFRLDPVPFQVAEARAAAKLAQARTDLAALKASYREKQAEIAIARTKLSFAMKERRRQADLAAKNFISAAKLDEATQGSDLAAQQITVIEQDLRRIAESLGGGADIPVERHPSYLSALAELDQARLDLSRTEIRASLSGNVGKPPKLGQHVTAGGIAMALVVSNDPWIEANFLETDLTHVHPGQSVVIHVDTYPNRVWQGTVDSMSPATGAEFSVIPAQNATGNWVKITQRLPVRIKLAPDSDMTQLRAGLSATVEIDTGHRRQLLGLSL